MGRTRTGGHGACPLINAKSDQHVYTLLVKSHQHLLVTETDHKTVSGEGAKNNLLVAAPPGARPECRSTTDQRVQPTPSFPRSVRAKKTPRKFPRKCPSNILRWDHHHPYTHSRHEYTPIHSYGGGGGSR